MLNVSDEKNVMLNEVMEFIGACNDACDRFYAVANKEHCDCFWSKEYDAHNQCIEDLFNVIRNYNRNNQMSYKFYVILDALRHYTVDLMVAAMDSLDASFYGKPVEHFLDIVTECYNAEDDMIKKVYEMMDNFEYLNECDFSLTDDEREILNMCRVKNGLPVFRFNILF